MAAVEGSQQEKVNDKLKSGEHNFNLCFGESSVPHSFRKCHKSKVWAICNRYRAAKVFLAPPQPRIRLFWRGTTQKLWIQLEFYSTLCGLRVDWESYSKLPFVGTWKDFEEVRNTCNDPPKTRERFHSANTTRWVAQAVVVKIWGGPGQKTAKVGKFFRRNEPLRQTVCWSENCV